MEKKRLIVIFIIFLMFIIGILFSISYYDGKYAVSFETGTDEEILTQYVSKNTKVTMPITPEKEGYIFIEWQLNGNSFNFDTEISQDVILSAKWVKEEYITINFESNSDEKIDSIKILKGSNIENLPIPKKDNYEFIGWYNNDILYDNQVINDDITLYAKYEIIKPEYKVGDKVIIIGSYSNSSSSSNTCCSSAIGWDREILYIVEDSNYPYAVGNINGVTGYFNSDSIELY